MRLVEKLIQMARGGDMKAMDLVLKRVAPERLAVDVERSGETSKIIVVTGIDAPPGAFVDGAERRRKAALGPGELETAATLPVEQMVAKGPPAPLLLI